MKPLDACHFLDNKAYFFPPPVHEDDDAEPQSPSTPFTCLKTHQSVGPDGEFVSDECCGPDRPCYRPEVSL